MDDPVSPGDCPLLLVGFAQLWGHPLSAGPANWYSPDMPTTFEQRLPVTVSLIVIEYLPVNSQFVDEALTGCGKSRSGASQFVAFCPFVTR
jgi:hypothetical protein